jgi:CubicO group peptidase (beta-lactamase class C family)
MTSANTRYPGTTWEVLPATADTRWDIDRLKRAEMYAQRLGSAAVVVVVDGAVAVAWGAIDRPFNCHSIRKSLFSGLFGIYVHHGHIALTSTLAELGIDDCDPVLTLQERQATVEHLLMSRSGVYHWANYQAAFDRSCLPPRGSYALGSFFMYNNWDFNALGTIFEQSTQQRIFAAFQQQIAMPLQMEDFSLRDTEYAGGPTPCIRPMCFGCRHVIWRDTACSICGMVVGMTSRSFLERGWMPARRPIHGHLMGGVMGTCGGSASRECYCQTSQ